MKFPDYAISQAPRAQEIAVRLLEPARQRSTHRDKQPKSRTDPTEQIADYFRLTPRPPQGACTPRYFRSGLLPDDVPS